MKNTIKGYALITGGTSGIGYELARCCAKDGYDLILVARSYDTLQNVSSELQKEFNVKVEILSVDLMIPGAARKIYDHFSNLNQHIEILINDAGQGYWGQFIETDLDREIDIIHLNVISLISLTKYYLKDMVKKGSGKILNVASSLSKTPAPYMSVYGATKSFVWAFTEALIQEVKDSGVTLTALHPGATDTDFFHKAEAENSYEYNETTLYTPEEVAKAGYEGMMHGTDRVIPGIKNKLQGMMGAFLPDTAVAKNMQHHMEESKKAGKKTGSEHDQSAAERERINHSTGSIDGDEDLHDQHVHEDEIRH